MGKSYSKQEEIIIAQNGANNAKNSSLEEKIEQYGLWITGILVTILIIISVCVIKKCNRGIKKWTRKEIVSAVSSTQIDKAGQTPAPVQYA